MYKPKMKLDKDQSEILNGRDGEVKAKIMETIVRFGDIFNADKLVKVTHGTGHLVTSFGISMLKPIFKTMDIINNANLKVKDGFTMDPRPVDYKNVPCKAIDHIIYDLVLYSKQKKYEKQLLKAGLRGKDDFSCTSYLKEVGNTPKEGDILSWAESSAVVFANSVLGARVNRNSGVLDLFGSIVGYVPNFGLLTDEGRKATWKIILKTSKLPEAQILGSAIGIKVMEDVPYVYGLDKYLGHEINDKTISYLKDFGAATASNGAVGLYHIDGLTPEAKKYKEKLIVKNAKEYVIDDKELERIYNSYPIMWKDKTAKPSLCFIGCPHLTLDQLIEWSHKLCNGLKESGYKTVRVKTVFTAAPQVVAEFKKHEEYKALIKTKATISSICPLMYTSNPLTKKRNLATCSNKLRTYSMARFYKENDLLNIIVGKGGK